MSILVTGANGLIGHHLCESLIRRGESVVALIRSADHRVKHLESRHCTIVRGDIRSRDDLRNVFAHFRIATIFHLAVERTPADTQVPFMDTGAYATNVAGTQNLLDAAAAAGVSQFIHSSAMMVFDLDNPQYLPVDEAHPCSPVDPNGLSVLLAEHCVGYAARKHGFLHVILRYPGVFGPGKPGGVVAAFVRQAIEHPHLPLLVRSNRAGDFVYVDDVVAANILAWSRIATLSERLLHIGSGESTTIRAIAGMVSKALDIPLDIREDSPLGARDFYFDCGRARSILGYAPVGTEHGIRAFAGWFKQTHGAGAL